MAEARKTSICDATVTLTEADRRYLNTRPGAVNLPPWHAKCELEDLHDGPHYAGGQAREGGGEHWITWDETTFGNIDLVEHDACPYQSTPDDLCLLFAGHPGAHNTETEVKENGRGDHPPPPNSNRSHMDYLTHRREAVKHLRHSEDPAQVHAQLALAAAMNRLADLQQTKRF